MDELTQTISNLAGIVLAMVAYGVVELVIDSVVGSPVEIDVPDPTDS